MTENKDIRNEIVSHFKIQLDSIGFKKKGNSLIRETQPGLIQVIDFGLGPSHSIMRNHLGLGFGIYTDEWFKHLNFGSKPKAINGSHCELCSVFNTFIPKNNNFGWIDLKQDLSTVQNQANLLITEHFIPQLNNLTTREQIIEQWKLKGNAIGLPPRGRLSIAILYWYLNKRDLANELIELELFDNKGKPYYNYIVEKKDELYETNA